MNKTEFICVKPKSTNAINIFETSMRKLHSCRVKWRRDGQVGLESITDLYSFTMFEYSDDHWEVIK